MGVKNEKDPVWIKEVTTYNCVTFAFTDDIMQMSDRERKVQTNLDAGHNS